VDPTAHPANGLGPTRTFGWSERSYGMTDTAIAAKKTVEVGIKQILEQR
jgi:hypothetical protein